MSNFYADVCSIVRALRILFRKPYKPTPAESEEYWDSKIWSEMGMREEDDKA
jgi:hypothetical protein